MTTRHASCNCGQLSVTCTGDPVRISMCHCIACQKRTGSVFGVQARFPRDNVDIKGRATEFVRIADSGNEVASYFCPTCGTTLYWQLSGFPNLMAVAVGALDEPGFPPPRHSVYERHRHGWAMHPGALAMEHLE